MAWDREKRGIFQRKQEKPQIKKHKPLDSEGSDGDLSIRQLKDGVFLFFKALGRWYKTLNTSSEVIPETPNSMTLGSNASPVGTMFMSSNSLHMGNTKAEQGKIGLSADNTELTFKNKAGTKTTVLGRGTGVSGETDANATNVLVLGTDNVSNEHGYLALGSGGSYYGGVIQGVSNIANADESAYLGVRILTANSKKGLSVVSTSSATNPALYLACHDASAGHIGLRETDDDPTAVNDYALIFTDSDTHKLYYNHNELNSGARVEINPARWAENMPFYFAGAATGRTYFRAADDVDGQNTWSNVDSQTQTSTGTTISVDAPNSVSGIVVPAACVFQGAHWSGYQATSASSRIIAQIWTGTLSDDEASGTISSLTLQTTNPLTDDETSFSQATSAVSITLAAGDVVIPTFSLTATVGEWYGTVSMKFEALA